MTDTSVLEPKYSAQSLRGKLSRMLRSMSRRYPQTSLLVTSDAFGVRLADGRFLHIVYNGHWSGEDMRDFLALFATWCLADPERLMPRGTLLAGVSYEATEQPR